MLQTDADKQEAQPAGQALQAELARKYPEEQLVQMEELTVEQLRHCAWMQVG